MAAANDTTIQAAHGDDRDGGTAAPPRPRAMVRLHWLTVLCLVSAAAVILTRDQLDGRQLRFWMLDIHRHLGLAVLLLFVLRVALRLRLGRLPAAPLAWPLRAAAALTHLALYAALLVLPVLGWMLSDASGKSPNLFGWALPHLVQPDEDLADQLLLWHQDAAWVLLGLALLHVGAALWHHVVLRDGVLRSMLPRKRS